MAIPMRVWMSGVFVVVGCSSSTDPPSDASASDATLVDAGTSLDASTVDSGNSGDSATASDPRTFCQGACDAVQCKDVDYCVDKCVNSKPIECASLQQALFKCWLDAKVLGCMSVGSLGQRLTTNACDSSLAAYQSCAAAHKADGGVP